MSLMERVLVLWLLLSPLAGVLVGRMIKIADKREGTL